MPLQASKPTLWAFRTMEPVAWPPALLLAAGAAAGAACGIWVLEPTPAAAVLVPLVVGSG